MSDSCFHAVPDVVRSFDQRAAAVSRSDTEGRARLPDRDWLEVELMMIASSGLAVMRAAAGREITCVRKGLRLKLKIYRAVFWSRSPISEKGPEVDCL